MGFQLEDDIGVLDNPLPEKVFRRTLKLEGGFTRDEGGDTNLGITQNTLNSYNRRRGLPSQSVKQIDEPKARNIYGEDFYKLPGFDNLPENVGSLLFDYGIQSSPTRAIKSLQKTVGVNTDGIIGPKTLGATQTFIQKKGEKTLLQDLMDDRIDHLKTTPAFKTKSKGLMNRIETLKKEFDLNMLNPFAAKEASADEIKLEDDAGIFTGGPTRLIDDLGILGTFEPRKPPNWVVQGIKDTGKDIAGKLKSIFNTPASVSNQAESPRVNPSLQGFGDTGLAKDVVEGIKSFTALPEKGSTYTSGTGFTQKEFTPEDVQDTNKTLAAFALGAVKIPLGRTDVYTDEDIKKIMQDHPVAARLGETAADLATLKGISTAYRGMATLPVVSKIAKAIAESPVISKLSKAGPAGKQLLNKYELERYVGKAIHSGATFGTLQAVKEAGIAQPDQTILTAARNIAMNAVWGSGLGLVTGGASYLSRVVGSGTYGGLTTALNGGSPVDVAFNTVLFAGFEVLGGPEVDRSIKLQAMKNIDKETYNYLLKAGVEPVKAAEMSLKARDNAIKQAGGLDKVLEQNSAPYMNAVASNIEKINPSWRFTAPKTLPNGVSMDEAVMSGGKPTETAPTAPPEGVSRETVPEPVKQPIVQPGEDLQGKQGIVEAINKKDLWRTALPETDAINARGKFYASSYKDAEFYGRPLDTPFKVNIRNPFVTTPENLEMELLGKKITDENSTVEQIFAADKLLKEAAIKKGYDSIVTVPSNQYQKFVDEGKIPTKFELNDFSASNMKGKEGAMEPLHTFPGAEGTESQVFKIDKGYSVVLRDTEAGKNLPDVRIFDTEQKAIDHAKTIQKFTVEETNDTADGTTAYVVRDPGGKLQVITSTKERADQIAREENQKKVSISGVEKISTEELNKFIAEGGKKTLPKESESQIPTEEEISKMTGEERADQVMAKYNSDLIPNAFGDTRPKIRRGDKDWTRIKEDHNKELARKEERAILKSEERPHGDYPARAEGGTQRTAVRRPDVPVRDTGRGAPGSPGSAVEPGDVGAGRGAGGERVAAVSETGRAAPAQKAGNYRITDADAIGQGGLKSKYAGNVSAIKLLKQLDAENRLASPEEQKILVKYVGWGAMSQAFDVSSQPWSKEYGELKDLLSPEEYKAARASTINAHYTAPGVINSIWTAISNFGFSHGRVLEPSAGVGHFIGLAPHGDKKFSLVELDTLSGNIAKHLYQDSSVQVTGLQDARLPVNFFDVIVSNIPFSDYQPYDPKAKQLGIPGKLVLHDYFFAKSLAHLKPGGILAFITSKGTMDKGWSGLREFINERAVFAGALRLPSNAFKENAGTEVVTDIIFLRKALPGEKITNPNFIETVSFEAEGKEVQVNKYFIDNPQNVLGKMSIGSGLYTDAELTVTDTGDFQTRLDKSIESLPKDIFNSETNAAGKDIAESASVEGHDLVKEFAFVVDAGEIYQKIEGKLVKQEFDPDEKRRIIGLIKLRDTVRDLLAAESNDLSDAVIEQKRKDLRSRYEVFTKAHGYLNDVKNDELFSDDPDSTLLLSLENVKKIGKKRYQYTKASIFTERVLRPHKKPSTAKNIKDALFVSLGEYGTIDWKYVEDLLKIPRAAAQDEALTEGLVFKDPNDDKIVLKDEYLSGNVKQKLAQAQAAAKADKDFARNVEELEKVQPADLSFDQISVRIGMPWIKQESYTQFLKSIGARDVKVFYNSASGSWEVEKSGVGYSWQGDISEYGTGRMGADEIFNRVANGKPVKVFDKTTAIDSEGLTKEIKILNEEETALAEQKADLMKEKFQRWFWEDDARRDEYVRYYNDNWNHTVVRKYDGSHLVFSSMSAKAFPEGLRKTQKDAIWRGITSNRLMLAHSVGAGKTAIMITTAMESKRLGLTNKTMVVAPKNTIPGWKLQINKLYPSAKVLIANEKTFSKDKRKKFLAKVALGDWDIVVIPERSFEFIQVSPEVYEEYVNAELDELRAAKEELKAAGSRLTVKNIEKAILQKEAKLQEFLDQSKKDDFLAFEELGVDALFVDEADKFKNLAYITQKQGIKGMGTQEGSQKASDMMMKTSILRKNNGKIVFATGTPISNSMVEAYTMMKYLQPEMLKEAGINSFDGWSNTFGEVATSSEVDVTGGKYKLVSRFKNFINVAELMKMIRSVWDIQTQEMLIRQGILVRGKNLPFIKGGKPQPAVLPNSPDLMAYTASLIERVKIMEARRGRPKKGDDNKLSILHDGRNAALDMRLIDPSLKPDFNSKVEYAIRGILERYKTYQNVKGAQVVFIDRVAPDKTAAFNPHYYMRKKLVAGGIPDNQIAFVHDYKTDEAKDELYEKVNDGDIRVLFGSTEKLGAGTNMQERLAVLWHIDVGWRPRDIVQREGRIDRPGNTIKEVEIYRLATKGSLDTFMFQLLEAKAKTINSMMEGDESIRSIEEDDINEYEALKALSSDNPMVKEKSDIDREVKKLKALNNAYIKERGKAQGILKSAPETIKYSREMITAFEDFFKTRPEKPTKETFTIKIGGETFTDKTPALAAIWKIFEGMGLGVKDPVKIGKYLGYDLFAEKEIVSDRVDNSLIINIPGSHHKVYGRLSVDPVGTFTSLDNSLFGDFSKAISYYQEEITVKEKEAVYAKELLEQGFTKEKELQEKVARQSFLEKELQKDIVEKVSPIAEVEEEIGKGSVEGDTGPRSVSDILGSEAGTAVTSPSIKKKVNDTIVGSVSFSDPEVEARYRSSKGVPTPESMKNKIRGFMDELWARLTRVYPTLPNKPEYAEIRNILSKQKIARSVSQDRTIRAIDAITAGFGHKKLDLFTRKIILDDLVREAEAGRLVPFGYSEITEEGEKVIKMDLLKGDKDKIDGIVAMNPDVQAAIDKRNRLWEAITTELVDAGVLKEESLKQDYFRHQILSHAQAKATFGTGKKLKTPRPGYARKRHGSTYDINTDYVQAEFEVMAQALHDLETVKNIKAIENSPLNIVKRLRQEAKEASEGEEKKVDWHTLIPDGYTTWQPMEGNVFFTANSVSDKIVETVLEGIEVGITADDIKKVMAMGAKRKEFVLPDDVADTLNKLYADRNPNWIFSGARAVTTAWKRHILMNPRRLFKYNYQNFLGDFDAVVAGDPRIMKNFSKAVGELTDVFYRGKPLTATLREFVERGGISTQMTVQELPELRNLEIFQRLSGDPTADLKRSLNIWRNYWQSAGTFTIWRESLLRYAAYLHYRPGFVAGAPANYGASIKGEVDALTDPLDQAAKVATELLGDYSAISAFGQDMREAVIPFYSWLEINIKRYTRLTRNAFGEGWQKGIRVSGTLATVKGSAFLARWWLRAAAVTALVALYNNLFFKDEEDELSEYDRNRMHINLGRDKDGNIRILRGQGAFSDLLEWFGLNESPGLWRDYFDGKASLSDLFGRIPFTDLPAFGLNPTEGKLGLHPAAMKILRGINPLYKLPFETATGKSLPVFDDRAWRVEDKMRNVLKAISLENEYDALMKEPSRGYRRSLAEAFITTQDPMENAYRYIQGEKYKFLETVKGRGGSGDYYSPRSILYRKYKKALRFNDEGAKTRIQAEMDKLGIDKSDIAQSIRMSDPLSMLNKDDKKEFVNQYLTQRDREVYLKRAQEYYQKTFKEK